MPKLKSKNLHIYLLVLLIVSLLLSIFLVYNSSSTYAYNNFGNEYYFLINQAAWVFVGLLFFFLLQVIPLNIISKFYIPLYFLTLFFLIFVLIPTPFSLKVYGARRWLLFNPEFLLPSIPFIGRLSFQPSELAKLVLCLVLPQTLLSTRHVKSNGMRIARYLFYLLVPALLVFLEPDLKSTLLILFIGLSILFASGFPIKYILGSIPVGVVLVVLLIVTSPYRMERLNTFLGSGDLQDSSYHSNQINIALGSGGIFGLGLGQSRQKNEYLPEVVGDSIFAVFGEEFGFVGSLFLVSLLFSVLFLLYKNIHMIKHAHHKLAAIGFMSWVGAQTFLNLGSVSGVIPLTGVPLPLISYGGSSLLFTLLGFGFVYKFVKEG